MKNKKIPVMIALAVVLLILLLTVFGEIATLVLLSFVQAYIFLPIVKFFEKYMRPSFAVLTSFLLTAVINVAVIILLVPVLLSQLKGFVAYVPEYINRINVFLGKIPLLSQVQIPYNSIIGKIAEVTVTSFSFGEVFSFLSFFLLMPVTVYYFLKDRKKIKNLLLFLIPEKIREPVYCTFSDINLSLRDYIFGETKIAVAVGALTAVLLLLFGFKYWLVLGLIMGIFNIIPYIGPIMATVPIVLSSLSGGIKKTVIGLVIAVAVQQADNLIIRPRVISNTLEIHPLTVILCVSAGNCIGNMGGTLLAVPLYITFRTVFREFYKIFSERKCKFRKKSKI